VSAINFRIIQAQPNTTSADLTKEDRLEQLVSHQTRELSRLRQAAVRDPLTGGANMRSLAMAFDWLERDDPLSMLFIDIDGFHKVNEALGRTCGDAVLTAVHTQLERTLRWDDVVAREGADRFVALLPLAIHEDAQAVAERLRDDINKMCFQSPEGRFRMTVRVGCASLENDDTLNDLMTRADRGCREARKFGGNVVSSAEMETVQTAM
jgi:diguanylate cyclase (GGDEF)-like protein